MKTKYSVIIPTLNEVEKLQHCVSAIRAGGESPQIIVADGGSADETVKTARSIGATVVAGPSGRGTQMNHGASIALGEVLLFLHADTVLPPDAFTVVARVMEDPDVQVATFRARFSPDGPLLRLYSFFTRFDSLVTTFGDQCLVVRSSFFQSLGGFPDWPLFEDVEFFRRAREASRLRKMDSWVLTSSRKFLEGGIVRQQVRNAWAIVRFLRGESPHTLASEYYRTGGPKRGKTAERTLNEPPLVVGQEQ